MYWWGKTFPLFVKQYYSQISSSLKCDCTVCLTGKMLYHFAIYTLADQSIKLKASQRLIDWLQIRHYDVIIDLFSNLLSQSYVSLYGLRQLQCCCWPTRQPNSHFICSPSSSLPLFWHRRLFMMSATYCVCYVFVRGLSGEDLKLKIEEYYYNWSPGKAVTQ